MAKEKVQDDESGTVHVYDFPFDEPDHILRRGEAKGERRNWDVFEFKCVAAWHEPFIKYSFDQSNCRGGVEYGKEPHEVNPGIVQFGALISLVCGVSSWIYPNHVFIDMSELKMQRSVRVGEKIRIFFEALDENPVKRLRITIKFAHAGYRRDIDDLNFVCDGEVRIAPFPTRRLKHKP